MTYFTINDPLEPVPINEKPRKIKNDQLKLEIEEPKHDTNKIYVKPNKFKIALFWICGIESNLKENFNEDLKVIQKVDTSIEQDPFWSNICDLNAVIALALCAFVIAFYNKYE